MRSHPSRRLSTLMAACALLLLAADWNRFRGPQGDGQSNATGLPTRFSASENLLWKAELPGYGASGPITWGNQVFVNCYSGYGFDAEDPGEVQKLARHVLCYDLRSGKERWSAPFETKQPEYPYRSFHTLHGYASGTPATDGRRLFVFFGRSGVGAFGLDGKPMWTQSVGDGTHDWGSGSSPVLYQNLVIVNAFVESGAIVALDKRTHQEVWRAAEVHSAWNTPLVVDVPGGKPELVISSQKSVLAYDPATGEPLWHCDGVEDYVCPSVIAHDGIVYAIGGRRGMAMAIRAGGRGDVTKTHRLWSIGKGSNVCSPVYHQGHLYWTHESQGIAYCVNAETGDVVYEKRLKPRPGLIYASPVVADGKIYIVSRSEGTFVLAAKPEFKLLAHNPPLDDSVFNASPAIADGKLLIRSNKALYSIGQ